MTEIPLDKVPEPPKRENINSKKVFSVGVGILLIGILLAVILIPRTLDTNALSTKYENNKIINEFNFEKQHKLIDNTIGKQIEIKNTFEKKGEGIKHNIYLKNKENYAITTGYSELIEIPEEIITWNGRDYQLTEKQQNLTPFYQENKLIVPNIFFGKQYSRINYKDIAEKGGYALVYKQNNKNIIELRIDNINLKPNEEYYLDPTYYNTTKGFRPSNLEFGDEFHSIFGENTTSIYFIEMNFLDSNEILRHYLYQGGIWNEITADKLFVNTSGSQFGAGLTFNGSVFFISDRNDEFVYKIKKTGINMTDGFKWSRFANSTYNAENIALYNKTDLIFMTRPKTNSGKGNGKVNVNIATLTGINKTRHYLTANGDLQSDLGGIIANKTNFFTESGDSYALLQFKITGANTTGAIKNLISLTGAGGLSIFSTSGSNYSAILENIITADNTDKFIYWVLIQYPPYPPNVNLKFPKDLARSYSSHINFTYNVSAYDDKNIVDNCSLYLQYGYGAAWERNATDISITQLVNQTFNITVDKINYYWKIGCYDNSTEEYLFPHMQGNSSIFNFTRDEIYPSVQLRFPKNDTTTTARKINFIYNATIPIGSISYCRLWLNETNLNKTDNTITPLINQSINITLSSAHLWKWKVECESDLGIRKNSTTRQFILNNAPTIPTIIYPINNTLLVGSNAFLNCSDSTDLENDTIKYEFYGGASTSSLSLLQNTTLTWYNWTGLIPDNYYWDCRANDNRDNSNYIGKRRFSIVTIFQNCTGETSNMSVAYNFTFKEEANITDLRLYNVSFESWWTIWGNNTAQTHSVYSDLIVEKQMLFCISPKNATFYTNAMLEYFKSAYDKRNYYLRNAIMNNNTQHVILYLLPSVQATGITINVIDQYEQDMSDIYVYVQRYAINSDSYILVSMGKTDTNGEDYLYLKKFDAWYRFILVKDGVIIFTSERMKISVDNLQFKVTPATLGETYEDFGNIQASLTFNNATKQFILSYTDVTGAARTHRLQVYKRTAKRDIFICDQEQTSASGTINCDVGNQTGIYIANYYATGGSLPVSLITSKIHEIRSNIAQLLGLDGIFASFMIVGVLSFIGLVNAPIAIALSLVGIIASYLLGFMYISFGALIGLIVVGIIIIIKLRN